MTPEPNLKGKRALVTGAASGIGLAIAQTLSERGVAVMFADLTRDRVEAAAAEFADATTMGADLSKPGDVHRLADAAGDIDILVNNAGLQHVSPVEDFDEAQWNLIIAVMMTAPFILTKRLIGGMYERKWGRIINIASAHGLVASPYKSAYVAAKHGIVGFTKSVALEAGRRCPDVTTHAICPSYVRTPLVEKQIADQARVHGIPESEVVEKVMLASNAVKRLIEPQEVANLCAYLCGDGAWAMTGAAISMDAGWLAH